MHSQLALSDWVIMAMEGAAKNGMKQSTLILQHCDMTERDSPEIDIWSPEIDMITTKILIYG